MLGVRPVFCGVRRGSGLWLLTSLFAQGADGIRGLKGTKGEKVSVPSFPQGLGQEPGRSTLGT